MMELSRLHTDDEAFVDNLEADNLRTFHPRHLDFNLREKLEHERISLNYEEQLKLFEISRSTEGDLKERALGLLFRSYSGLVLQQTARNYRNHGVSFEKRLEMALTALSVALAEGDFDPSQSQLHTYICRVILNHFWTLIPAEYGIPSQTYHRARKVWRHIKDLEAEVGVEAALEAAVEIVSAEESANGRKKRKKIRVNNIRDALQRMGNAPIALDEPLSVDSNTTFGESLPAPDDNTPGSLTVDIRLLLDWILTKPEEFMNKTGISSTEYDIFLERMITDKSLAEVGEFFGLKIGRVRKLYEQAIKKLRLYFQES